MMLAHESRARLTDDDKKRAVFAMFRAKKATLSASAVPHMCCADPKSRNFCNPENTTQLIRKRLLPPSMADPRLDHILVCDKWGVHECDDTHCQLWADNSGTCPLTGLFHGVDMVSDRHMDGDRVHVFKKVSAKEQAAMEAKNIRSSSSMHVVKRETVIHTTTTTTTTTESSAAARRDAQSSPAAAVNTFDVDDLGLALMESLVEMAMPDTDLRISVEEILIDGEMPLKNKVTSMAVLLRTYAQNTHLKTMDKVTPWLSKQISDYKSYVAALHEAAELAAKPQHRVRRRKMVSSGNMFGAPATVIVEEAQDVEAEELEAKIARADRRRRKMLIRQRLERREDGSLIIPDKRGEDEDEDSDLDEEERLAALKSTSSRQWIITPETAKRFGRRARRFIEHLMYGPPRQKIIDRHEEESARMFNRNYQKYLSATQQTSVSYIESMEIAFNSTKETPISLLDYDRSVIDKYVEIVTHVWRVVAKYGPASYCNAGERVCVYVTLATLYRIRGNGLSIRGLPILPRDSQMLHLPHMNDLRLFRLQEHDDMPSYSRSYTLGCEVVRAAFEAAMDKGEMHSSLQINLKDVKPVSMRSGDEVTDDSIMYIPVGVPRARGVKND